MNELTTPTSFIVRIYRVDPHDPAGITGVVEAMDGRGQPIPFTCLEQLAVLLSRTSAKRRRRRRKDEG